MKEKNKGEKLKYIFDEIIEARELLNTSIENLYEETPHQDKVYFPVPSLLLCFCFLDFLRRVNYIFMNGKDGRENSNNRDEYENFLGKYIIGNDKYNEHDFSFNEAQIYEFRCDLVHSFSIREKFLKGEEGINFIWGGIGEEEEVKQGLENGMEGEVELISMRQFLEAVKEGQIKMLNRWENEFKTIPPSNINDLYNDLQEATRFYRVVRRNK